MSDPMPVLDTRYIVVADDKPREFRMQRNALSYMRHEVNRPNAIYNVTFNDRARVVANLYDAMALVKDRVRKRLFGERVVVRTVVAERLVARTTIHVTGVRLRPADTQGVPNIDRVVAAVDEFWPNRRYAGICVCKPNSDHADCAAVDWFDTWDSMSAATDYFLDHRGIYGLKYIILGRLIYSEATNFSPRDYTGDYHTHVHASVYGGVPGAAC